MSDKRKQNLDKQHNIAPTEGKAAQPLTSAEEDKVTGGIIPPRPTCFICPKCGKTFTSVRTFDAHVKTHL